MELHHAINRRGARGFFASANSSAGFYSLFGEVFSEEKLRSLYILKGGPGTGKSTLLDTLSGRAEGEGYGFEALLCSSDPASLDGIVIDGIGVAVLDGTAPHSQEPHYPGVCGEIVNLGELWDGEELRRRRRETEEYFQIKSEAYARAYRLLRAAGIAEGDVIRGYERAADMPKLEAAVKRLLKQRVGKGDGRGTVVRRFITAYSVGGCVRLKTLDEMAEVTVTVNGSHGFGRIYMNALYDAARLQDISMTAAPDALLPEYYEAIFFPTSKVLVKLADGDEYDRGDVRVNCGRFVRADAIRHERSKLRFSEKAAAGLCEEALISLAEAGKTHAEIEKIYKNAMDFDGVTRAAQLLEKKIFG